MDDATPAKIAEPAGHNSESVEKSENTETRKLEKRCWLVGAVTTSSRYYQVHYTELLKRTILLYESS